MKIEIEVPDGVSGEYSVETFVVPENDFSQKISLWKTGRAVPGGTYKKLKRGLGPFGVTVMSNTPDEIRDFQRFVCRAKGKVLVNGLGIGVLLKALLNKPEVTEITVIEKSADVIKLVAPTYQVDSRVTIINDDAFTYQPPKEKRKYGYDAVWHDIWDFIDPDNLPEMHRLHRKYGRMCIYQESWCRAECEKAKRQENKRFW